MENKLILLIVAFLVSLASANPVNNSSDWADLEIFPEEVGRKILESGVNGREGRIVYGKLATANQFPHFAYLVIYRPGYSTFCGSTLIAPTWVVTAAHCLRDCIGAQAFLGSNDKTRMKVSQSASGYAIHSEYNQPSALKNDIGLVLLAAAVPLSSSVKVIQLPPRSDFDVDYTGKSVTACGFGQTSTGDYPNQMQFTYLRTLSSPECSSAHWVFRDTMLCARGTTSLGEGVCYGDSGGPLMTEANGVATFVGVNSFVQTEQCIGDVQGFTRVDHYLDWINAYTGIYIRW